MILLDTHAWLWWLGDPDRLSASARDRIEREQVEGAIAVSAISAWEAAMLVSKGRLELTLPVAELVAHCERLPMLRFVSVDPRIAVAAVALVGLHADPADRIIVATGRALGAAIVTKDTRLHAFDAGRCVW